MGDTEAWEEARNNLRQASAVLVYLEQLQLM